MTAEGRIRAAVIRSFDGPGAVELTELDTPGIGPDDVLVETAAAGVNPVDWKILYGGMRAAVPHHLPLVPGWDIAGTVLAAPSPG